MNQEQVWDEIAQKWQEFRTRPFEDSCEFLKNKKGKILDLCCGSGRNFSVIEGEIYGVDFSGEMLKYAKEAALKLNRKANLQKVEVDKLPFEDNFFDSAIFVASLHCIDSKEQREDALKELYRVLKPKARVFLTVWSENHDRIKKGKKEQMLPWTVGDKKYERYYYIYSKDEIKDLLNSVGFKIINLEEDENIVVEIEK